VIEIDPAQEILIGLACARMLRHGEAGHDFHDLARPQKRTVLEKVHLPFASGGRPSDRVLAQPPDKDLFHLRSGR